MSNRLFLMLVWYLSCATGGAAAVPPSWNRVAETHATTSLQEAFANLVRYYTMCGKIYTVILAYLRLKHDIVMSLSTLKRIIRWLGLRRSDQVITGARLLGVIKDELKESSATLGYRQVWRLLLHKHGIRVPRWKVMVVCRLLDPEGVELRKARRFKRRQYNNPGPNFVWHMDGYDKLVAFGIGIEGCIDGFSRKILWLTAGPTNRNAGLIALHYLQCVERIGGTPRLTRTDHGGEYVLLARCQMMLHHDQHDAAAGPKSHKFGKSIFNQRIEAWWSILRRFKSDWWISFCKDLCESGQYDPSIKLHRDCFQYVFLPIIQRELDDYVTMWNEHRIRLCRDVNHVAGVPNNLYYIPGHHGRRDFRGPIDRVTFLYLREEARNAVVLRGPTETFCQLARTLLLLNLRVFSTKHMTPTEGLRTFRFLLNVIQRQIDV